MCKRGQIVGMAISSLALSLYLGVIALLFGLAALRFWFILHQLHKQVPKPIAELTAQKPAFVVGHVVAPVQSVIRSPYSDSSCVGFVANVEQKVSQFDPRVGFLSSQWSSIGNSVRTSPFLVKDATGTICVLASRAQLSLSRSICGELDIRHVFRPVQTGMRWFAKRVAPAQSLWVSECLLCDGDAVFVSGTAQPASQLDKQFVPAQFHSSISHVIKGPDVIISTTVPASHIPFYEKCLWFCSLTCVICVVLLIALLLLF